MDSKIEQLKTLIAEGEKYTFQNFSSRDVDYDRSRYGAEDTPEWLTWKTCVAAGVKIPMFRFKSPHLRPHFGSGSNDCTSNTSAAHNPHNSYASRNTAAVMLTCDYRNIVGRVNDTCHAQKHLPTSFGANTALTPTFFRVRTRGEDLRVSALPKHDDVGECDGVGREARLSPTLAGVFLVRGSNADVLHCSD
jgi:hypothetical protein